MPARARKRKFKRRKPSSRKKARRRRTASRPLVNPPSSDEDFVPDGDGDGDESSSGSAEQEDSEEEEDPDEEEESENEEENFANQVRNSDVNVAFSARRRNTRRARNGLENTTSLLSQPRRQSLDADVALEDNANGGRANGARRVRIRHRRQDSSDEDFEVDMERVFEDADEDAIANRPMTRAMDSCQVSDLHERHSAYMEDRGFHNDPDALEYGAEESFLRTRNPQEAHASIVNSVEIDKRKGKEKALEGEASAANVADEETTTVVCGICWTDMVVAERGKLDSCDHFFCFGCIMEWAKVESRCPMCKQRFTTIARSGTGTSKRPRTIRIPLRNQVYIPPEDPDLPPEDPYADIVCMECQGTGDEGLLLLCDRCDAAAHTFCVGLGRSVPRGDWYCRECQALTGGMSGSEDEGEDLAFASGNVDDEDDDNDDEDVDTEFLLRSIVASVSPERRQSRRSRQARAQRRPSSISSSIPSSRNVRDRLWQRLSRQRRGRYTAAPRLSQAARALLSSTLSELGQVSRASEAPQSGSARTVPQQRRLYERINEMRNNWGRIQNGDLHFDALRREAMGHMQQPVSSNSSGAALTGARGLTQSAVSLNPNVAPIPPTPSVISMASDKRDANFVERSESSAQGEDLERAWRMMGHAQSLSGGIGSSRAHELKLSASPSSSALARARQPTENTSSSATSKLAFARKNLDIPACHVPSPPFENSNAGICSPASTPLQVFSNLKHDEMPLKQMPRQITTLALIGESRNEDLPPSSSSKQTLAACKTSTGFEKDPCISEGVKSTGSLMNPQSFKSELSKSVSQVERKDDGITPLTENLRMKDNWDVTENKRTKVKCDVSAAGENVLVASSSLSPPHEGLKIHLTELVKKQTWPVYITERLDKEQFKRIARAAVHSLLALCDPNNKATSLSCVHFEEQGNDPIVKCCNKCLDQHVEKAVRLAKNKIIPS